MAKEIWLKEERQLPKLNQDNTQEFICEIIEHFEDFLEEKGITIENREKQEAIDDGEDPESICNIYGSDYGNLASEIELSLKFWELIPKDPDEEYWKNDICPPGDGVIF